MEGATPEGSRAEVRVAVAEVPGQMGATSFEGAPRAGASGSAAAVAEVVRAASSLRGLAQMAVRVVLVGRGTCLVVISRSVGGLEVGAREATLVAQAEGTTRRFLIANGDGDGSTSVAEVTVAGTSATLAGVGIAYAAKGRLS